MNNPEDYASDTDDSDCDFDPTQVSHEAGSEEEEDDEVCEDIKTKNSRKKITEEPKVEPEPKEIPEVDEKKADDLWTSFQNDDKEPANGSSPSPATSSNTVKKPLPTLPLRRLPPVFPAGLKRPAGGLGNILGQLGKKNKLSVLEQSKKDWNNFKKDEGLNEELNTFNKGKDGYVKSILEMKTFIFLFQFFFRYLERQDFLERTDYKQFEIEKQMRQTTRRSK